jgi:phosphoglycerate dehydrogenase-like enzyme
MDLRNARILVTPTSFGSTDPKLKITVESEFREVIYNPTDRALTSEEVIHLIPGVDGYLAGLDEIDANVIRAADRLKVISRYGVGTDRVDLKAAQAMGIRVTNTPGVNAASVAELTIGLMISLARRISEIVISTKGGGWPRIAGQSLEGKTVGLLGLGAVGKQVARRLVGFDCRIAAYDPNPDLAFVHRYKIELLPMADVITRSDFLSLHVPLTSETRNLVDKGFLEQMKQGAYLVNTARGELIDEEALAEAIQIGKLSGAAMDVFTQEPPGSENPLVKLPQVLVTPHCASHTDGAMNAMGWMAMKDCMAVLRGEEPKYPVI